MPPPPGSSMSRFSHFTFTVRRNGRPMRRWNHVCCFAGLLFLLYSDFFQSAPASLQTDVIHITPCAHLLCQHGPVKSNAKMVPKITPTPQTMCISCINLTLPDAATSWRRPEDPCNQTLLSATTLAACTWATVQFLIRLHNYEINIKRKIVNKTLRLYGRLQCRLQYFTKRPQVESTLTISKVSDLSPSFTKQRSVTTHAHDLYSSSRSRSRYRTSAHEYSCFFSRLDRFYDVSSHYCKVFPL